MTCPTCRNRNAEVDFRSERRSNAPHASTTDPEVRLLKTSPGTGAILCLMGHSLMDMRHVPPSVQGTCRLRSGMIVQAALTRADGQAERRAAINMLHRHSPGSTRRLTLAADRGYDSPDFVAELRQMVVTPHVAQKSRHPGYAKSQRCRKKIEEPFDWAKTVGGMAQTMYRDIERVRARFTLTMAARNLARLPKLLVA